jgi:hypothetical protein
MNEFNINTSQNALSPEEERIRQEKIDALNKRLKEKIKKIVLAGKVFFGLLLLLWLFVR